MAKKKKSFADDGWAVWVDGEDASSVYINEWLNPKGKSFADIAVSIRGVISCTALNIYFPFGISENEIEDISLRFSDRDVLRAIFSTACVIDFKKNPCTSEIAYNGKTVDLVHLSAAEYSLKSISEGTLLTLDLEALRPSLDNDEAYIILRIPHKSLDEIFKKEINAGGILRRIRDLITTPMIEEDYGYSVRINETRLLPTEVSKIGSLYRQKIQKATVTISIDDDYELNDHVCYRVRRMEQQLYHNYSPDGFDVESAITYQWQQNMDEKYHGQFNFYFNIERDSVSKLSMLFYMIFVLIIGMSGDAGWDLVKTIFGIG